MKYIYIRSGQLLTPLDKISQNAIDSFRNYFNDAILSQKFEAGDNIIFTLIIEKLSSIFKEVLEDMISICETHAKSVNAPCHFLFHDTARMFNIKQDNLHYLDTWAWVTYKHSKDAHRKRWYSNSNKALFLVGKPLRLQRIGLLDEFNKHNALDYLDFTFHLPATVENIDSIKSMGIAGLDDNTYIHKLLIDLQRPSLDLDLEKQTMNTGFEFTGFPTNLKYYRNTCMSVVSENSFEMQPYHFTEMYSTPYLTEKIFRSIINHHPFILIGDVGIDEYVESCGYKTFNKFFLPITDESRKLAGNILTWAATSVKHFIENKHKHIDEINDIVEHNYRVFMSKVPSEIDNLQTKFPKIDLNHTEIFGPL